VSEVPPDLHYTSDHEWVQRTGADTVRVGITDFAQSALGDVVFVQLPDAGAELTAGESFGEVESTKSVSDLYAPLSAKVIAVNGDLDANTATPAARAAAAQFPHARVIEVPNAGHTAVQTPEGLRLATDFIVRPDQR